MQRKRDHQHQRQRQREAGPELEATLTDRGLHKRGLCSGESYLVKMSFTKKQVTAMLAELAALRAHVYNLIILVEEIVASHRLECLHSIQLLERHTPGRRTNDFDRRDIRVERQRRTEGACVFDR